MTTNWFPTHCWSTACCVWSKAGKRRASNYWRRPSEQGGGSPRSLAYPTRLHTSDHADTNLELEPNTFEWLWYDPTGCSCVGTRCASFSRVHLADAILSCVYKALLCTVLCWQGPALYCLVLTRPCFAPLVFTGRITRTTQWNHELTSASKLLSTKPKPRLRMASTCPPALSQWEETRPRANFLPSHNALLRPALLGMGQSEPKYHFALTTYNLQRSPDWTENKLLPRPSSSPLINRTDTLLTWSWSTWLATSIFTQASLYAVSPKQIIVCVFKCLSLALGQIHSSNTWKYLTVTFLKSVLGERNRTRYRFLVM